MTSVRIGLLAPTSDGTGRRPTGTLEWRPTMRRDVAGDVVLPAPFTVGLADPPPVIDVAPTEAGWAWAVVERVQGGSAHKRLLTVPDVGTVVDYADLVEVDPATLDPVTLSSAWWTQVTDYVATHGGAVASVNGKTGTVVLNAADVSAQPVGDYATNTALTTGLSGKVNSSTYTAGLAAKQDTATLGAAVAADATVKSALDVRYQPRNRITKRLSWWYAALATRETATATAWVCGDSNGEGSGSPTRWLDVAADALVSRYPTSGFTQRPRYYPCRYENSGNPTPWVFSDATPLVFDTTSAFGFGGRSVTQPKFNASSATVTATLTVTGQLRANVLYPTGVGGGNIEVRVNGAATPTLTITPSATAGEGRSSTVTLTGGTDTIELRAASSATPARWNGVLTWDGTDHGISVIDASHAGLSAVDYNNAQVVNRTTLRYLAGMHSTMRPDLVLIPLSYNDYNQKLAPSATKAALQSMIASIRAAFANVSFMVIAHTDSGAIVGPAAPWSDYVAALKDVADSDTGGLGGTSGVDFMDLGDVFVAPAVDNSLGAYGADKVHFTTTIGHPIVGQAVAGRLSL